MRRFVAEHNFDAVEDIELSVAKGELLESDEPSDRDGWMMVHRVVRMEERGFVPVTYLRELSERDGPSPQPEKKVQPLEPGSESTKKEITEPSKVVEPTDKKLYTVSRNEIELAKLKRQRGESLNYILGRLDEAIGGIRKCHQHTAAVGVALNELETTIHSDHSQWKQLIDEEKAHLMER
eukprot:gene6002-4307_t